MDYDILESSIENGKHMYKLAPPSEWLSNGIVTDSDINNGVKIWKLIQYGLFLILMNFHYV